MGFKPLRINPSALGLLALCAAAPVLASAAAQVPTQSAPPTQVTPPGQTTPPSQPDTPAPGANSAAPAPSSPTTPPAQTPSAPAPTAPPPGGASFSAPSLPAFRTAPLGGHLPDEPASLTPGQIIGSEPAPGVAAQPQTSPGNVITLTQALARAQANEPTFAIAVATAKNAKLDQGIARAALLPSVGLHNQYLFTQSAGSSLVAGTSASAAAPRFIANNAVHEYVTQGTATETIGLARVFALSRANALAAVATAELELSRRGLISTVISLFYAASTSQGKIAIQQRALEEANDFLKVTREREAAREAAHADVLKAELTQQQRQRDLADAELAAAKARLDLGVLLFPDPATPYTVALPPTAAPPRQADVQVQAAAASSPEIASANAALLAQNFAVGSAQAAYLPELSLNYSYGIDSTTYAIKGPDGHRNLGYSASATLDLPIFDWFATPDKIRQAHNLRDAARSTLGAARRTQAAHTIEFFNEVQTAYTQLNSLAQSVATAQESLHLTRLRYNAGEATVLEVVDAESSLALSQTALNDGTTRYQLALANLQILTGTR